MRVGVDKFFPPQVDTPQFLFRERVVDALLRRCGSRKPAIVLEAQAGQGKTTVIKQFLDRLGVDSAWYQITPEDADPAFFLAALHACLGDRLADRPAGADIRCQATGDVSCFDLPKRLDHLLNLLRQCLKADLYLVFDDLHHLIAHESSLFIVNYLVENAPPTLHFILSSREPLPLDALRSVPGSLDVATLGNPELALDGHEVADLFQEVFRLPLSSETIREISLKTDGWVMGVLLFGLQMAKSQGEHPLNGRDEAGGPGEADIREYFRRKVFDPLEPHLHEPLLTLSLLEDIPVALAEELTGEPAIGSHLIRLAQRNVFIRRLDPDATIFGLHHLFRQFLREKAEAELSPERVRRIHRQAGQFFLLGGNHSQALRSFLKAGDYAAIEEALHTCGTAMLGANQTATLTAILGAIPEPDLERLGWASLILALAHLDFAPARALPLLSKALAVFSETRDELGELLCLAHIISIHITTTGHYREGLFLLERAEELFERLCGRLDVSTTILIARSLAMGRCIFLADTEKATRYADLALSLARKGRMVNFEAALLMVMGYIRIFAGHLPLAKQWMERAADILRRPEVGTFNCLASRMMLFNFLFHDGDFINYFDQKNQMVEAIGQVLFSQSIAGPFCHVWEMDIAINQGRFEQALRIADKAETLDPPLSPHLRSQVLQLKAVVLSLDRQTGPALDAAEESTRLRGQAGGAYFVALNKLMTGLALGLCGQRQEALALLTDGIASARAMPTAYLESCGLMHRGAIRLEHGDLGGARQDIESGLGLMRRNSYRHFWAWTPQAIRRVLEFAVASGIETGYARTLGRERIGLGFKDSGEAVPHIEFRTLGGFTLLMGGVPLLNAESLTPGQRELLCLLLASPGLKLAQDSAQLHFWPDSSPGAAKTKFDTMMSRLRKTLAEVLPDTLAHCHLNRDRGMIWLANCRVDALDFLEAARRGLEHSRQQEFWQAGNAFTRADALWQGEFAPGITGEDCVSAFRYDLSSTLARMALAWGGQLALAGRIQPALDLTEKALRADPLNEALWALLHRLHGRRSAIQARQVATRFTSLLRAEGYPEAEIAAMVRGIVTPAAPA